MGVCCLEELAADAAAAAWRARLSKKLAIVRMRWYGRVCVLPEAIW